MIANQMMWFFGKNQGDLNHDLIKLLINVI